ncbi:sulfatase-like hydrolase/transferase [Halorubrum sp. CBA1125]|uniref:sulfatase-like hydrolase/transferase n=1 Tax=Halorubrum sp. CBA1125 TaxID=2668072 RepID=UPI0012E83EB7|nr:sulfatase-like hydrolase/transferase [Halorubrum sp. CBA1125]MUW13214.1 sulfatase-like hydrolase/transferase [Halorubrum sp. CBA1125]
MKREQPNILLVVLDSVRAKNTSLHNYPIETTPNLNSFSENATKYTQARAPGIHSIASHASIFSGYHVEEHKLFEHESNLDENSSIWPQLVQDYGYSTGLFSPNVVITEASNLAEHFQYTVGPKRFTHPESGLTHLDFEDKISTSRFIKRALKHQKPIQSLINGFKYKFEELTSQDPEAEQAEIYISEFLDWQEDQEGPWAACINLMDAHYPYVAQPEFRLYDDEQLRSLTEYFEPPMSRQILCEGRWWALSALECLYDECIRQADAAIRTLLDSLKRNDQYDDTLIIVTSDHGEAFGEFSQVSPRVRLCDHSWGIHEVQTHVPLVVKHPGQTDSERIDSPASLTEFPAVVRKSIAGNDSLSFVPESGRVLSSTYRVPEPGITLPKTVNKDDYLGPWRAVYETDGTVVIKYSTHREDGATVTIDSAQEYHTVAREYPSRVDEIFSRLNDSGVKSGLNDPDEEIEDRLEALGYMR